MAGTIIAGRAAEYCTDARRARFAHSRMSSRICLAARGIIYNACAGTL
jgi:hypothetical protein